MLLKNIWFNVLSRNFTAVSSFKRLYPGEYVSFELGKHDDKDVCVNVTGINGGPLLVENTEFSYRIVKSFNNSPEPRDNNSPEPRDNDES